MKNEIPQLVEIAVVGDNRRSDPWIDCPLALAGAKTMKRTSSANRKQAKAVDLMNRGIGKDLKRAEKLVWSAAKDKQKADVARKNMEKRLDEITQANSDIDAIAAAFAFNSSRLRRN